MGINPETIQQMRVQRDNAAALIIDVQEKLFPHIHENDAVEKNTGVLIQGLQVLGIPLLVTQQYSKGLGATIPSIRALFEPFRHIEKTAFSCCDEPRFLMALEGTGCTCILIAGIEAHVCVLQTVLDMVERGYKPVVIEDCISSRKPSDKKTALERMKREGAVLSSYESILFELCRYSGTEEFKAISALVK